MRPDAGIPSHASGVARCTAAVRALLSDPTRLAHFRTTLRLGLVGDTEGVGASDPRPLVTVQCVETEGVDAGDVTDTRGRGFFRHPPPRISVVAGRVLWRAGGDADLDELLRHELTHAADLLVHGMDLASCGGLACSEIRAASEAECRDVRPARRRACVRAKARTSAGMVFSGIGGACVDNVFDACYGSALSADPTAPGTPFAELVRAEERRLQSDVRGRDGS